VIRELYDYSQITLLTIFADLDFAAMQYCCSFL
jgi:hypothetical protein